MLGGAFFPIQQSGSFMATASLVTPHAWFLRGIGDLAPQGTGIATVLLPVAMLLLAGLVTGALGLARARGLVVAR